ncbi:L-proline glycine betaine binding ABC transporter protein ProX [Euzebya pacifica]|uniref:L-proline glycine betaine binding ABC transporter protein ProX n=1 Tax=Euzebya pacifica TaxID=1608957 RepID=A0A346Y031_9ACTN|nr:ABC transporter substrate-binding protein [Euzebya pacifica]AXV07828.1 L-proline glycine betaine binding ABC transporter protein ProX [Euzebya pacifica]
MTTSTRSRMAAFLLMLVLALVASACASDDDGSDDAAGDASESADGTTDEGAETAEELGDITVGSTNFDEQELVAEMYALALEDAGYTVERRYQLGSREVVLPALTSGEIDVYPEYVGTALEFLNEGAGEATGDTEASTELLRERFAEQGVDVLEPSDAQDKNGLVVRQETADTYGLSTVSDLADVAGDLTLGGPPECPERPLCIPGYESAYGVTFGDFRSLDAGSPVTIEALSAGEIDVALLFTTDGVIAANDWVLLDDDQDLQPAENIVPVIRSEANTDAATEALDAVSAVLTTENVTEMIRQLRVDLADPAEVAETFLTDQGVLG